jgi:hypothetical protein
MTDISKTLGLKREAVKQEIDGPAHIDNPLQVHLGGFFWRFILTKGRRKGASRHSETKPKRARMTASSTNSSRSPSPQCPKIRPAWGFDAGELMR